jgi:hypothetical protein
VKSEIDIWWAGWLFHHQRQIETVRLVCDAAEKVLQEARKVYGLSTRQGPVALTTLDKAQAARIAEQEKLIRAASNYGDGLRIPPDQQQMASVLPSHIASALGTDGGLGLRGSLSALPPSGHIRPTVPQQVFLLIRSVAASELKFSDSWSYCL